MPLIRCSATTKPHGFTVTELLVSIGILSLLVSTILPAVQYARESARRSECRNHLKQIVLACHEHQESFGNFAMPRVGFEDWRVRIIPFLEQAKPVIIDGRITGGSENPRSTDVRVIQLELDRYYSPMGLTTSHAMVMGFPSQMVFSGKRPVD